MHRFRAALPHELDGCKLTEADLPLYVKRVEELAAELIASETVSREWELHALDLERRLRDATAALRKIANEDYRGPRPGSIGIALTALAEKVEPW